MGSLLSLVRLAGSLPELQPTEWGLSGLSGRLSELGGGAAVTIACGLLYEAQQRGDPTAWISDGKPLFFPPDVATDGIDLEALIVVRAPGAQAALRAGSELARSGAFALLVIDLASSQVPPPLMTRLLGLAQKHEVAVLFLSESPLGSLISLRAETQVQRRGPFQFECGLQVVKDKRRAPGWSHVEVCRGTAGLR